MEEDIIKIYADGSCLGNPGPGGYAAILLYRENSKTIKGSEYNTTNNRMELLGVINALKALKKTKLPVHIYVDSSYVYEGITNNIKKREKNNWKLSNNEEVKNVSLWKELLDLTKTISNLYWYKVKGHGDDAMNNLVDKLARSEAKKLD